MYIYIYIYILYDICIYVRISYKESSCFYLHVVSGVSGCCLVPMKSFDSWRQHEGPRKMRRVWGKMFDTYGKYMDLMMCVEIISHKFDLETHVSRLDLLVIRFGQRTNLKLMRKKIAKKA